MSAHLGKRLSRAGQADHSNIQLWLYNYGKVDVRINTFYMDGQLVTFSNLAISVGAHMNMNVTKAWIEARALNEEFDQQVARTHGFIQYIIEKLR